MPSTPPIDGSRGAAFGAPGAAAAVAAGGGAGLYHRTTCSFERGPASDRGAGGGAAWSGAGKGASLTAAAAGRALQRSSSLSRARHCPRTLSVYSTRGRSAGSLWRMTCRLLRRSSRVAGAQRNITLRTELRDSCSCTSPPTSAATASSQSEARPQSVVPVATAEFKSGFPHARNL